MFWCIKQSLDFRPKTANIQQSYWLKNQHAKIRVVGSFSFGQFYEFYHSATCYLPFWIHHPHLGARLTMMSQIFFDKDQLYMQFFPQNTFGNDLAFFTLRIYHFMTRTFAFFRWALCQRRHEKRFMFTTDSKDNFENG